MAQIVPSILSADFARLADEIGRVERAGIEMLHVDIMDGHFVENLTIGPPVVESIRKVTKLRLDLHLMIEDPQKYAPIFIEAGADQVSIHQEACRHLDGTIRTVHEKGAKCGVVLNPATPIETLSEVLDLVDYVLVMSVNPGLAGKNSSATRCGRSRAWRSGARSGGCGLRSRSTAGWIGKTSRPLFARDAIGWWPVRPYSTVPIPPRQ